MRTPSESSISLRFSSRVPNRGSRLGVISRAIFKGFDGPPGRQFAVDITPIAERYFRSQGVCKRVISGLSAAKAKTRRPFDARCSGEQNKTAQF